MLWRACLLIAAALILSTTLMSCQISKPAHDDRNMWKEMRKAGDI